jgi:transposase
MLRHVKHEGASKADTAALFGMSRPAFYQVEAALEREGLAGLLPRRRGPKGAHKLTSEVMEFIKRRPAEDPEIYARALAGKPGCCRRRPPLKSPMQAGDPC